MNIEFGYGSGPDFYAQRAWHNTMRYTEANKKALRHFIEPMLMGAWAVNDSEIETDSNGRPVYRAKHPVTKIVITANPNDCEVLDGSQIVAYEFDWCVYSAVSDKYGTMEGEWKRVINGGLINHARHQMHVHPKTGEVTRPGDDNYELRAHFAKFTDRMAYGLVRNWKSSLKMDHERNQREPSWASHT